MSGWRGRGRGGGYSSYNRNANRLRDKLESRNESASDDQSQSSNRPPPGLKGKDIGLWFANRNKQRSDRSEEKKLLSGPSVSLSPDMIKRTLEALKSEESSASISDSNRFRMDFLRHNQADFFELLKSKAASRCDRDNSDVDERLYNEFISKSEDNNYVDMMQFRQKLPAYRHKDEIVELIEQHQVILVEGNTGCGKTTQVAQYILDYALLNKKGSGTRILCTQPRRIAAILIAERVASERAEPLGTSVGYQIRLEKEAPRNHASVNFCTTGVLLKFMESDPALNNYSHIIIDEIHERNVLSDVCLALIKHTVTHRKDLKVILMSATLNAESFSRYFNDCPTIHIEGFCYDVQELFLEDVLEETGYDNFRDQKPKKEPKWVQYKNKKQRADRDDRFEMIVGNYANSLRGRYSAKTINTLMNPQTENIDEMFIEHLIEHICSQKQPGAILVILSGFTVISRLYENLQKSPKFPKNKFVIYPLHSLLTGSDQRSIFIRPPEGVRKIILSTPLAETSITIEDVVFVINAGKMRKPYFDFDRNATVLEDQWITKANETQRKGRAGRCQKGFCFHLYTRGRSNSLEAFEEPEILRIRFEETLLTIKVLCIKHMKDFIQTFIDVPKMDVVDKGIIMLQRLGALTDLEELTPLGLHLARLSAPPQIGKMLLFSSIFSCFDPISSVAAGLSFKSPFYTVMGKEDSCNAAKRTFSNDSDQLAVASAIAEWEKQGRERKANLGRFCYENFLSQTTLTMLGRMKNEFGESLHQSKFLSSKIYYSRENNLHSKDINVLRAVICGGLYPNIAYRNMKVTRYRRREIFKTINQSVKLVPSSVNCDSSTSFGPGYLVFHEQHKFNNGLFLTETTANIGPYAILMFGDRVGTSTVSGTHYISVGDIVKFKCNPETADLIEKLRDGFNRLLEKKIAEPSPIDWEAAEGRLMKAIVELVSFGNTNPFEDYGQGDDADEDED